MQSKIVAHFRFHPTDSPNFRPVLVNVALQSLFDSPTVRGENLFLRTYSLDSDCIF